MMALAERVGTYDVWVVGGGVETPPRSVMSICDRLVHPSFIEGMQIRLSGLQLGW